MVVSAVVASVVVLFVASAIDMMDLTVFAVMVTSAVVTVMLMILLLL